MIAEREGMHKKLQAKIQHKDKEVEVATEEEIPPEWNAIPDLIMENQDDIMITEADTKHKRDEVAWGRRKRLISSLRNMNILPQYLR